MARTARTRLRAPDLSGRFGLLVMLAVVTLVVAVAATTQGVAPDRLLALTVRGVMLGGILALGAIGLSLIFGVLNLPHFAHGELMTVGAYLTLALLTILPDGGPLAPFSFSATFLLALAVVAPAVGMLSYLLDRGVYRPLRARGAAPIYMAMSSLAIAFGLRSIVYLLWGADFRFFYPGRPRPAVELFAGIRVRPDQLFILGLALALIVLVYLLLERTKMGKAMRATADNPELARVAGIDVERVVLFTWMIGGSLAAIGGAMYGLDAQMRPEMGWWLLLPLFAAVILGTIGNPYGALAGGLIIGVAWQLSSAFLNPAYGPAVAFVLMILVLLVRPEGLFGVPGRRA
ncbi:MAG: branched-chain amino acid ABC transporter permease [Trueperaceae bacterium]|nr:branched-chain amino acid ABC transporter permease [Trueperaceae bacterium]